MENGNQSQWVTHDQVKGLYMCDRRLFRGDLEEGQGLFEEACPGRGRRMGAGRSLIMLVVAVARVIGDLDGGRVEAIVRLAQGEDGQQLAEPDAVSGLCRLGVPVGGLQARMKGIAEVPVVLVAYERFKLAGQLEGIGIRGQLDCHPGS